MQRAVANKVQLEHVKCNSSEEYEAIQLLDSDNDDLEEGEVLSDVDKSILEDPEATAMDKVCFKCKTTQRLIYQYECAANLDHLFCIHCTYISMNLRSKDQSQ